MFCFALNAIGADAEMPITINTKAIRNRDLFSVVVFLFAKKEMKDKINKGDKAISSCRKIVKCEPVAFVWWFNAGIS